jgi:pectate disaccharide-lyase
LFDSDHAIVISNCWTWHNGDATQYNVVGGSFQGNGNGFKLGSDGSKGTHVVMNCVSFNNNFPGRTRHGFDQNSHTDGVLIYNCVSFGNLYNYFFEDPPNSGKQQILRNNTSNSGSVSGFGSGTVSDHNSWQLAVTVDSGDFNSMSETAAEAPRQPDGSLPTGFIRLVNGSDLIDKGVDVGIPYCGSSPDLGAFENCP